MSPITSLSILLQPILDGRKRQNAATMGNTNDSNAKTKAPTPPHLANLNNLTTQHCRKACHLQRLWRSTLTGEDHIRREEICQSHLTQFFFVSESLHERTASMMRKRAQHEVFHVVLTFLIGEEKDIFSTRRHSFHHTKAKAK